MIRFASRGPSSAALALSALLLLAAGCGQGAAGSSDLAPAPHSAFFVVAGSHQAFTCDQCHPPSAPSFSAALGGVDCLGCHTDATTTPQHADVPGYTWATATCIGCHRSGTLGLPPNHDAALFPVTGTSHAGLGCSQCHGATRAPADLTCVPCHAQADMASRHAAIPATATGRLDRVTYTNYQWASAYCVRCHADGQVQSIASHPTVRHGLSGEGHAPFCVTCHGTFRTDKPWGALFTTYSCLACHTDNNGGGGG